ncbi:LamG-like jellyroll fold domain-containing protein [Nocardioides sp. GXZ039]|uniref:LamG-like jellyroll fold domain-containing protein n=1 Tax=Nocardioides sp. GXZ039 TaxID=3136018 RepID=UPI0030F43B13
MRDLRPRRSVSAVLAMILTTAGAVGTGLAAAVVGVTLAAAPSHADTTPDPGRPATVSADGLPTWQVNGIVWNQVLVGNTVYATGNFTKARPPGVAVGGAGEVPAGNIFAFDVRTGNRITSFNHTLNGVGQFITASPDGSRVYVGGDFTTVDGIARGHLAAFNTADGSLVGSFAPSVSSRVSGITASNDTVWIGGSFFNVNGSSRTRLAAVRATNGSLLPWAPAADADVDTMVLAPGGDTVVVGGSFNNLGGAPASGMGAVDAVSAEPRPWAANTTIRNGGNQSAIVNLRTDGTNIYGSGWAFGTGNFEGTFSADAATGNLNFLNDCHGDTYDAVAVGQVLYNVSHVHNCHAVDGGFPESNPRWVNMQHASAYTNFPVGQNHGPDEYGWNFDGVPAPEMLQWYPELALGSASGQSQAAWSISADSRYVVLGGEFPRVNGVAQQGLVRFAAPDLAPNKQGPRVGPNGLLTANALALGGNSIRVSWQAPWDIDNENLTYEVFRNGGATPVYTTKAKSRFWNLPMMAFRDSGLQPGVQYRYQVRVSDPFGNRLTFPQTAPVTITAGEAPGTYADDVVADGATAYWRLGEPSGAVAYDWAGANDAAVGSGVSRGTAGAISGTTDRATTFDGTSAGTAASPPMTTTANLTVEAWVKTTSNRGGKIVGYGSAASGDSGSYDRHLYLTNDGRAVFGVWTGATRVVTSSPGLNDGQWHHVVGVLDAADGLSLWVDGRRAAADPTTRSAQPFSGRWRIGGDNLGGWPNGPSSNYLAGAIDDVAIYPTSLSRTQIQRHFTDSGRTLDVPPAPTDDYGREVVGDEPMLYWRLGEAPGATSVADASGNLNPGVFPGGGVTLGAPGALAGTTDTAAVFNGASGTIGSTQTTSNPRAYSEELWFKTTTTQGGKLIGFGDRQSGTSSNYDRHVYMEDSGQLTFGVYTGTTNTTTTADAYNDGQWHHVVATQGADGMRLYVDGIQVGSNPQTAAQDYTGYWRVGGDSPWNGRTYFQGTIDEVAVYPKALSAATVGRHFQAGGGHLPNQPPHAAFTSTSAARTVHLDAAGSADPDGTIAGYAWDFGDGQTGTGVAPEHTYAADGTYPVTLTVTDDRGAQAQVSHPVTVTNTAPQAAFSEQVTGLGVAVDATASKDPDGTIASYAWDWGDGTPAAAGVTAAHTYAAAGTYTVTLTVTDDLGGTDAVSHPVTVAPVQFLARDDFGRTTVNGWGDADLGGTWVRTGTASRFAVAGGQATISLAPSSGPWATLSGVDSTSTDVTVSIGLDKLPVGGAVQAIVRPRVTAGGDNYHFDARVQPTGAVQVLVGRKVGTTDSILATVPTGLTYAPGQRLLMRAQATGTNPTTLRVKLWPAGTPEPAGWLSTTTDAGAGLQTSASIGLSAYLSGAVSNAPIVVSYDELAVRPGG